MNDNRPVGVFDSGLGGLTVLKEICKLLPNENLIYLGDTARVPYGSKSRETIIRYAKNNIKFLSSHNVKMVVVACNTASAYALPELLENECPVIGVVEGGVEAALKYGRCKWLRVGVIGTEATINSMAYTNELYKVRPGCKVITKACPLFVPLVEEGWVDKDITKMVAEEYLASFRGEVDCLILGCTHYPMLKGIISKTVGKQVRLIDSAKQTANLVKMFLLKHGLIKSQDSSKGEIKFFVTDSPKRSLEVSNRMLSGINLKYSGLVDIGP
jgi:glutamate racemase